MDAGWAGLLWLAQASAPLVAPESTADLFRAVRPCHSTAEQPTTDIIVCATEDMRFRLEKREPLPADPLLPKAKMPLLGGESAIETEAAGVGGIPSNRVMVKLRWKF